GEGIMKKSSSLLRIFLGVLVAAISTMACAHQPLDSSLNRPDEQHAPIETTPTLAQKSLQLKLGMSKDKVSEILGQPQTSNAVNGRKGFVECIGYYGESVGSHLHIYFLNSKAVAWSDDFRACQLWGIP